MMPLQERPRALSREKQSLLIHRLRQARGVRVGAAAPEPEMKAAADAPPVAVGAAPPFGAIAPSRQAQALDLLSAESVADLSNDEVSSLLAELMTAEASSDTLSSPSSAVPVSLAAVYATATPPVDTTNLSDDDVAKMLAELLEQEASAK